MLQWQNYREWNASICKNIGASLCEFTAYSIRFCRSLSFSLVLYTQCSFRFVHTMFIPWRWRCCVCAFWFAQRNVFHPGTNVPCSAIIWITITTGGDLFLDQNYFIKNTEIVCIYSSCQHIKSVRFIAPVLFEHGSWFMVKPFDCTYWKDPIQSLCSTQHTHTRLYIFLARYILFYLILFLLLMLVRMTHTYWGITTSNHFHQLKKKNKQFKRNVSSFTLLFPFQEKKPSESESEWVRVHHNVRHCTVCNAISAHAHCM